MVPISVEQFAKFYAERNRGEKIEEVMSLLNNALHRKKAGAKCQVCDETIWAIGSAISGFDGCFACITGESDSSQDYEVF